MNAPSSRLTLVVFESLGYTGTSWANLVVASHGDGFMVGPPDRGWKLRAADAAVACLVHGADCPFWPGFLARRAEYRSYLEQLAEFSGRRVLVLNNPSAPFWEAEVAPYDFDVRTIKFVRDGRANAYSARRHHPQRYGSFYDEVRGWYLPALRRLDQRIAGSAGDVLLVRYEDLVERWQEELPRIGRFIGADLDKHSLEYWEFPHHLTAGNTGVIETLRVLQGLPAFDRQRSDFYEEVMATARERRGVPLVDREWERALSGVELAAYEYLAGPEHEALGYALPAVSEADRNAFRAQFNPPADREEALRDRPLRLDLDSMPASLPPAAGLARRLVERARRLFVRLRV